MCHRKRRRARAPGVIGIIALFATDIVSAQEPSASPRARESESPDVLKAPEAPSCSVLVRAALIDQVLARNPSLEAAAAALRAARARVAPAGAFDDLMVSYSLAPLSIASERVPFGQQVEVGQALPWPGKRGLRTDVARAEEAVARSDVQELRLRLALMASQLYDQYFLVHRAFAINEEHVALLETIKQSAEAQYVVGRASQQDPLQAEVELSHLLHERLTLGAQISTLRAQINALLHRVPQAELPPVPENLPLPDSPPAPSADLQAEALRQRPELAALRARLAGSEAGVKLAQLGYYPDLRVMGSYNSMWMDRAHQFMAGVSVNVPVLQLGARRAEVEGARAELAHVRSTEAELTDSIRAEVHTAREHLIEAHHVIELYEQRVLPAARDQVAAARAGFTSGRNSFQAVVEAQRNLRTAQLRLEEAVAAVQTRQAELSRALGEIPALARAQAGNGQSPTLCPEGLR